jgi:hypothetical protein
VVRLAEAAVLSQQFGWPSKLTSGTALSASQERAQ